ncbi:MAG: hypothetical protein K5694_07255 [Bacilli bacterium]|nr:hypothetical protein [Bacilli bacterium]
MKKKTNNKARHIVMILDRSGSMQSLKGEAISGCNDFIAKQAKEAGNDEDFSLVVFNSEVETVISNVPMKKAKPILKKDYVPSGCTALLDAIGINISRYKEIGGEVFFIIMTDGMENASKHYNYSKIKQMIAIQESKGWQFLFLASGLQAEEEGIKLRMRHSKTFQPNCEGTLSLFRCASKGVSNWRNGDKGDDD